MLSNVRLYFDTTLSVTLMAVLGIISGLIAAGLSGDSILILAAAGGAFILTGAVLVVRLWRATQKPTLPLDPGT